MLGFLSDQMVQGVLNGEPLANRPGGFAMFLPDFVKVHVKLHWGVTISLGARHQEDQVTIWIRRTGTLG